VAARPRFVWMISPRVNLRDFRCTVCNGASVRSVVCDVVQFASVQDINPLSHQSLATGATGTALEQELLNRELRVRASQP
jgi:hypothetical protein